MKDFIKLLSVITGLFRSIVTILFLLAILFIALVDVNLLVAFLDIVGFTGISTAVVKPLMMIGLAIMFIINFIITRHIFKAGNTGDYFLSNFFFALIFLALDAFIFISLRNLATNLIYVFFAFNAAIAINSILGLIAKARGQYMVEESVEQAISPQGDFIEFEEDTQGDVIVVDEDALKVGREAQRQPQVEEKQVTTKTTKVDKPSEPAEEKEEVSQTKIIDRKEIDQKVKERVTVEKNEKLVFEGKASKVVEKDQKDTKKPTETSSQSTNDSKDKTQTIETVEVIKPSEDISTEKKDGDIKESSEAKNQKTTSSKVKSVKRIAKKRQPEQVDQTRPILIEKNKTNKVSYGSKNLTDKITYGDEESAEIRKNKEDKKFNKSNFIEKDQTEDK